ncbi:MAG: carbon-nitrogen family hydrolase [Halobacteriota archaeon]|nr:carbon-nitrogen family hydrolase [Halobacteriota archaeon]
MTEIKIAEVQMDVTSDVEENLKKALGMMDAAVEEDVGLICLPELFTTGFDYDYINKHSEGIPNSITEIISRKAGEYKVYVIAGSIPERAGEKIYNTSLLFDRDGEIVGRYSKIHLFPVMDESNNFTGGRDVQIFDLDFGTVGIAICYDLRFPELFRKLAVMGAKVIFVPSEFPNPKIDHWRTLLQARAIENQIFVVGVNRIGKDKSSTYFGHSMVVDPRGRIIAEAGEREEVITANLDFSEVEKTRKRVFYLKDRVSELY